MPVICPTCQIFLQEPPIDRPRFSIKSLNRRRDALPGKGLGRFHGWRRTRRGGRLLPSCKLLFSRLLSSKFLSSTTGLCCTLSPRPRCRPPNSPGTRDRGPGGISHDPTCHPAHVT